MTKQPEAWMMNQIGETDHERLARLYDCVINEGGEDCLTTRVNNLENSQRVIVRLGWAIVTAIIAGTVTVVGTLLMGHIK